MGFLHVKDNESSFWLKVCSVPLVISMGKGTEGVQKMSKEIHAENEGVVIPIQVR
jgi:hypothetical protein